MVAKIPNDIFQFSTVSALMAGLSTSGPTTSQLPNYGTHGLGTLSDLNGEILYLDGKAWHMTTTTSQSSPDHKPSSDAEHLNDSARDATPTIRPAAPDAKLPFVQVTTFHPEFHSSLPSGMAKDELLSHLSSTNDQSSSGGKNSFLPFLITGSFKTIDVRIAGPKRAEETLAEVTARAPQWRLGNVRGRVFGVLSPGWSQGISVGGFHGHFIEDSSGDGSSTEGGERRGGHVLAFEAGEGTRVEWGVTGRWHLGFPSGSEWEGLELGVDAEGIHKAEG